MPSVYIWKGRTESGQVVSGVTEAENEAALILAQRKGRKKSFCFW